MSPQAQFFAKYIPDPNSGNRAIFAPSQTLDQDQFTIRVDQTITSNERAFVRWSFINYQENDPNAFPALGYASLNTRGQNIVGALISNLTPRSSTRRGSATCRMQSTCRHFCRERISTRRREFRALKTPGTVQAWPGSFPDFSWSGYASLSGSTFDQRPKTQDLKVWEFSDNLTWVKGRHILKFGGQFRHWVPLFTDSGVYEGQWTFNGSITQNTARPAGTGDAFADFMLGIAILSRAATSPRTHSEGLPTTGISMRRTTSR